MREAILSGWITTGPGTKNRKSDFGICGHGKDGVSELGNGGTGDGAAPAGHTAGGRGDSAGIYVHGHGIGDAARGL